MCLILCLFKVFCWQYLNSQSIGREKSLIIKHVVLMLCTAIVASICLSQTVHARTLIAIPPIVLIFVFAQMMILVSIIQERQCVIGFSIFLLGSHWFVQGLLYLFAILNQLFAIWILPFHTSLLLFAFCRCGEARRLMFEEAPLAPQIAPAEPVNGPLRGPINVGPLRGPLENSLPSDLLALIFEYASLKLFTSSQVSMRWDETEPLLSVTLFDQHRKIHEGQMTLLQCEELDSSVRFFRMACCLRGPHG